MDIKYVVTMHASCLVSPVANINVPFNNNTLQLVATLGIETDIKLGALSMIGDNDKNVYTFTVYDDKTKLAELIFDREKPNVEDLQISIFGMAATLADFSALLETKLEVL